MNTQKCRNVCPANNRCNLMGDVDHMLHLCADRHCSCHSAERYAEARRGRQPRGYVRKYVEVMEQRLKEIVQPIEL